MPWPLDVREAAALVDWLLERAAVPVLGPGPEHWRILREILTETGTAGNLTTDAHLAALAIENGAALFSTDGDFSRFRGLRWVNPLKQDRRKRVRSPNRAQGRPLDLVGCRANLLTFNIGLMTPPVPLFSAVRCEAPRPPHGRSPHPGADLMPFRAGAAGLFGAAGCSSSRYPFQWLC